MTIGENSYMKVQVALHGCDDSTYFEVEADKNRLEFLKELSEKSQSESDYACMPVLEYKIIE